MSAARTLARSAIVGLLVAIGPLLAPAPAAAQPKPAADEATRSYVSGRKLLEQSKFAEALAELQSSMKALPSPNTELLIGHALRELGRRGEAADVYDHVIETAGARVREGEARYRPTLEEAGRWLAVLRTDLGEIAVVVPHAPKDTVITIDDREIAASASGDEVTAHGWSESGARRIAAKAPSGARGTAEATVTAGTKTRVEVRLATPAPEASAPPVTTSEAPPPVAPSSGPGLPPVPVWIAAGVGVAGFAVFGIFGAMSASRAGDLDACSPSCPVTKLHDADAGRRDQTIANIGLIAGAAGLAAAGVLWVVLPGEAPKEQAAHPRAIRIAAFPGAVAALGRF